MHGTINEQPTYFDKSSELLFPIISPAGHTIVSRSHASTASKGKIVGPHVGKAGKIVGGVGIGGKSGRRKNLEWGDGGGFREVSVYYHFAISTFPVKIVIRSSAFILEYLLQLPISRIESSERFYEVVAYLMVEMMAKVVTVVILSGGKGDLDLLRDDDGNSDGGGEDGNVVDGDKRKNSD
ncbi:hypothetical protein Tco_0670361 [Tanacetum coccineum]